jgi:iron complex transport system substrate-binding protein
VKQRISVFVAAIALLLAGCEVITGSGDDSGRQVNVGTSLGTATIYGIPQRIVAMGTQWLDVAEVLQVQPVGYVDDVAVLTGEPAPWEPPLPNSKAIDVKGDIVAQVRDLHPDLILTPSYGGNRDLYDKLHDIAPTLANLRNSQLDSWESQVAGLGKILDKQGQAESQIANLKGRIEATAARYPGLKGRSFVAGSIDTPTDLMMITDANSGTTELFTRLGLQIPENLIQEAGPAGRVPLPLDRLPDFATDLLVIFGTPDLLNVLTAVPAYSNLPSVQRGSVVFPDNFVRLGLDLLSPGSIPYVLDRLESTLANAAK